MKNIVLTGMSGIGKTEKGKHLANLMNWDFLDTDDIIVKEAKISIDDIFIRYGEDYFREMESKVIEQVSKLNNTVISTGGGVILRQENIENLRKNGFIFLVLGKIQSIVDNLNKSKTIRPLLKNSANLYEEVETLFKKREKMYLESCDGIIQVDGKSLDDIADEIINTYEKLLSCSK